MRKNHEIGHRSAWILALTTLAVLLTAGMLPVKSLAAKPDFTGTWILNEEKSEIGEGRYRPSATLEVKQDKINLTVVRVRTGRNGEERKMESVYSLDGKETTNGREGRSTTSTVKWSEDGNSLVIHSQTSWTREGETFKVENTETWMLGEKGATLTVKSHNISSRGESSTQAVYDRSK